MSHTTIKIHLVMKYFFLFALLMATCTITGQDLDEILEEESQVTSNYVLGTFNGTRLLNGHSVETRKKGILEFLIQHRFGAINTGFDELFGLDESNIRFGFEYAFTDDLTVALGRSSFEKTFDGYVKYRLLKQREGTKPFPVSLTLFGSATLKTVKDYEPGNRPPNQDRMAYTTQILLARKFSEKVSVQLMPSYVHFNSVPSNADPNDMFAVGFGTRVKISKRISINGEYYLNTSHFKSIDTKDALAFGVDIETGGHIFQLIFTNSRSMLEKGFIAETTGDFFDGDIHFGFNISRAFQIVKPKDQAKSF